MKLISLFPIIANKNPAVEKHRRNPQSANRLRPGSSLWSTARALWPTRQTVVLLFSSYCTSAFPTRNSPRRWLAAGGIPYCSHNYQSAGLPLKRPRTVKVRLAFPSQWPCGRGKGIRFADLPTWPGSMAAAAGVMLFAGFVYHPVLWVLAAASGRLVGWGEINWKID